MGQHDDYNAESTPDPTFLLLPYISIESSCDRPQPPATQFHFRCKRQRSPIAATARRCSRRSPGHRSHNSFRRRALPASRHCPASRLDHTQTCRTAEDDDRPHREHAGRPSQARRRRTPDGRIASSAAEAEAIILSRPAGKRPPARRTPPPAPRARRRRPRRASRRSAATAARAAGIRRARAAGRWWRWTGRSLRGPRQAVHRYLGHGCAFQGLCVSLSPPTSQHVLFSSPPHAKGARRDWNVGGAPPFQIGADSTGRNRGVPQRRV